MPLYIIELWHIDKELQVCFLVELDTLTEAYAAPLGGQLHRQHVNDGHVNPLETIGRQGHQGAFASCILTKFYMFWQI